jgi:hypothetical protein
MTVHVPVARLEEKPVRIAEALVLSAALAAAATVYAQGAGTPAPDGLVAVGSRQLDEVAVRPGVDLAAYRAVFVEPGRVALRKDWLKDINSTRGPARWLTQDDARRIVEEAAARRGAPCTAGVRARGDAIATAPGPGVLRLSPAVADLDVYAPDVAAPGIQRYYVRYAGQAALTLEARDSVSGTLVARVVDRRTAEEVYRINRATSPTNAFWFDALFGAWATACASVLSGPA